MSDEKKAPRAGEALSRRRGVNWKSRRIGGGKLRGRAQAGIDSIEAELTVRAAHQQRSLWTAFERQQGNDL
jgi:hypothetical protein